MLKHHSWKLFPARSTRRFPAGGLFALVCLLALVLLAGCHEKTAAPKGKAAPLTVGVVVLHPESVPLTTELPGRTSASLVAEVRPQVDGIIRERLFREGSTVKAGDVLYRIEPSSYKAAYQNALAALSKAESVLPSSESKAKRYAKLISRGAISDQDYRDAEAAFQADKAAVASAQAQVTTARINLDHTEIKAPINGRIGKSSLTPGTLVTANQATPLSIIRCLDPINVDLTQSSTSFLNLRQAIAQGRITISGTTMPVQLKLENNTIYPSPGTLEFSETKVNEGTGTYTMRAEFPNPHLLLMPGMYVRAIISEGSVDNGYLVPQRAVSRNTKGEPVALFVDKDDKVEERVLTVTRNIGNSWLVESGLHDGDRIIVRGTQFVRTGQLVTAQEMTVNDATGELRPKSAEKQGNAASATKES